MFTGRLRQSDPLTTLTDGGLSLLARRGDAGAFGEIYRRHSPQVYRFSLQMTGSPEAAEEITQEVFLALLRDEAGYDENRGRLDAFLLGVARNLVRRHFRAPQLEAMEDQEETADGDIGILEDLTRREALAFLRDAVSALPEAFREVVVLCEFEELSYEQAAE